MSELDERAMSAYCATIFAHQSHFAPKCHQTFDKKRFIFKGLTLDTLKKSEPKYTFLAKFGMSSFLPWSCSGSFIDIDGLRLLSRF